MNNTYYVSALSEPENLNQYECNECPYKMTMKYTIQGFKRVVFVVEVESDKEIRLIFMDNIEDNYSVRINDKEILAVCNEIMSEYFKRQGLLN